jgi:hypothetical protein
MSYSIYRFDVVEGQPFPPPLALSAGPIAIVWGTSEGPPQPPPTSFLDTTTAVPLQKVAYYVVANFADGSSSGTSNFATIVTPGLIGTSLQLTPQSKAAGLSLPGTISGGYFGQPVSVGAQLNVAVWSGDATGTLTVSLDGQTPVTGVPLSSPIAFPSAVYPAPLSAGNHTLRVDYSGDASYAPTSVTANVYVTDPINNGSSSYYSIVCDTVSDWNQAQAYAGSIAYVTASGTSWGHLATITSAGEDATVMGLVEEAKVKCSNSATSLNLAYFLGGTRTTFAPPLTAGWTWVTGEQWSSYTNWGRVWGAPQPSAAPGSGNTLLYWATYGGTTGGWGNGTTNPVGGYVIEFEPSY